MITPEEASYLQWLGSRRWSGEGDVVEIGPWLGGSTWCLASGMAANHRRSADARLHVVDNFRWREFMTAPGVELGDGDSFRHHFERNLESLADLLAVHEVRLPDEQLGDIEFGRPMRDYDSGLPVLRGELFPRPVEILFVDGAKSWTAMAHLLRELAPTLTGDGLLVLQDFKAPHAYWVPMTVALLRGMERECLTIEHVLPENTVAWRTGNGLATAIERLPESIEAIGPAEGVTLVDSAAAALAAAGDTAGARIVGLAAVSFLAAKGAPAEAVARFRASEGGWPVRELAPELEAMRRWLEERTGAGLARTAAARRRHVYHRLVATLHRARRAARLS